MEAKGYRDEEPDEARELSTADLASRPAPTRTRSDDEPVEEREDDRPGAEQPEAEEPEASDGAGEGISVKEATFVREETMESLLPHEVGKGFQERWEEIQASFVDEPRTSVEAADQLVAEVMQRLAEGFARERSDLEQQWDRGEDVSTEDLRVALQRYRSFFQRLLAA